MKSTLVAAAALAVALCGAPGAQAQPLPEPDPVPVPGVGVEPQSGGFVGESGGETRVSAPSVGTGGATLNSYADPVYTVPNINGDPCTGAWESVACYAMHFDTPPAVQPRSEVSSSP